jgi:TonB family protein
MTIFALQQGSSSLANKKISQNPSKKSVVKNRIQTVDSNTKSSDIKSSDPRTTEGEIGDASPNILNQVREKISAILEYPSSLKRRRIQGTVFVHFVLNSAGGVEASDIIESSGHSELDHLALIAITNAAPFQEVQISKKKLNLKLHIDFRLNR